MKTYSLDDLTPDELAKKIMDQVPEVLVKVDSFSIPESIICMATAIAVVLNRASRLGVGGQINQNVINTGVASVSNIIAQFPTEQSEEILAKCRQLLEFRRTMN